MPNSEDYAIVVGINNYPDLRSLSAAERDATRFAEWLHAPDGGDLPIENIHQILSSDYKEPSSPFRAQPLQIDIDEVYAKLGVDSKTRVGRRLYFYFAGHGLAPSFDDVALLMANAARTRLSSNIGLRKYRSFLHDAAPFDEVIIFLDCCRDFEDRAEPQGPMFTNRLNQDRAPLVKDFLMLAAGYGRKAFEPQAGDSGDRRGLLTEAILKGLKEDEGIDGQITAASLAAYVKRCVPELAKAAGLKQAPEIPVITSEIVFTKVREAEIAEVGVTIEAAPGLEGELVLKNGELKRSTAVPSTRLPGSFT